MQSPLALARALESALPVAELSEADLQTLVITLEAARRIAARRLGDARQARRPVARGDERLWRERP